MDPYSSGEEKVAKIRKAYTITKQREKWTEEEHGRFLEALKLYGRAWQRIEEHIGTKNAVQIRSHAQKFFLKLEKDASAKGVPVGQVHDIDIPPPRPKRKPSNPYPRKIGALVPTVEMEGGDGKLPTPVSSPPVNQISDLHNGALQREAVGQEKPERPFHDDCGLDVLSISLAPPCASLSFNKPMSASTLGMINVPITNLESLPSTKKVTHVGEIMKEPNQNPDKNDTELTVVEKSISKTIELEMSQTSPDIVDKCASMKADNSKTYYTEATLVESAKSYPTKVAVQSLDRGLEACRQTPHPVLYQLLPHQPNPCGIPINQTLTPFTSLGTPAPMELKPSKETYPPSHPPITSMFTNNEEGYRSYLQFSSAFSNLTVSTLQQNPAAYAAATSAATIFWPNANVEAPGEYCGGFPSRIVNAGGPSPSVAAIAAATVAAATAWWASNGLIPFCASHPSITHSQSCFSTENNASSSFHTAAPKTMVCQNLHQDFAVGQDHHEEAVNCLNFPGKNSAFKPLTLSPEKSDENQVMLDGKQASQMASTSADKSSAVEDLKIQDSNAPAKNTKQVDRSSSGSNTTCSSELEIDALEKHGKEPQESNDPDNVHSIGDSSNRRNRAAANTNDSWKEVSEEGRVAFRALFSREVLPQSFPSSRQLVDSLTQTESNQGNQQKPYGLTLPLDLNSQLTGSNVTGKPESEVDEQVSIMSPGKLKGHHKTGFKLYKRCSVEGKEMRVLNSCSENVEKGPKRICLEGREASP